MTDGGGSSGCNTCIDIFKNFIDCGARLSHVLLGIPVHTEYRSEHSSRSPSAQRMPWHFCSLSASSSGVCPSVRRSQQSVLFIKNAFSRSHLKCKTLRPSLDSALTIETKRVHVIRYFLSATFGHVTIRTGGVCSRYPTAPALSSKRAEEAQHIDILNCKSSWCTLQKNYGGTASFVVLEIRAGRAEWLSKARGLNIVTNRETKVCRYNWHSAGSLAGHFQC